MPKLLFVTPVPFTPQSSTGAEHSILSLLHGLARSGWKIEAVGALLPTAAYFRSLQSGPWQIHLPLGGSSPFMIRESRLGFPCWRLNAEPDAIGRWLDRHLNQFRPDVILGKLPDSTLLLKRAARRGYRSVGLVRSTYWIRPGWEPPERVQVIANSPFAADRIRRLRGKVVPVVYPTVEPARYRAGKRLRRYITFINPVPEKGLHIALRIARRMPEARFLFVRGKWWWHERRRISFRPPDGSPPNVEVWDHQEDMRRVYRLTDLLLVPSQIPESCPRVILEAQINGIPAVAGDAGGISHALGRGGVLISPKGDAPAYVKALRRLRSDPSLYRRMSALALRNSRRPEFRPQRQLSRFISLLRGGSG